MSRLALALPLILVLAGSAHGRSEAIPVSRAGEHVGEEVTIEGRVVSAHAAPLATVLAFTPNFAGFTATILAADRPKFPNNFEQRYRDKLVRVTGVVTAYRGKPEMRLREPSQLQVVPAAGETPLPPGELPAEPSPPTPPPTPDAQAAETARALAALEDRVGAIETRLAAIEQALRTLAARAAGPPPGTLHTGLTGPAVRAILGDPRGVTDTTDGGSIWQYAAGRTVSFDSGGRVIAWTGF
jgi:hypothetical protein